MNRLASPQVRGRHGLHGAKCARLATPFRPARFLQSVRHSCAVGNVPGGLRWRGRLRPSHTQRRHHVRLLRGARRRHRRALRLVGRGQYVPALGLSGHAGGAGYRRRQEPQRARPAVRTGCRFIEYGPKQTVLNRSGSYLAATAKIRTSAASRMQKERASRSSAGSRCPSRSRRWASGRTGTPATQMGLSCTAHRFDSPPP